MRTQLKRRATWLAALTVAFVPVITNMVGMAPQHSAPAPVHVGATPSVHAVSSATRYWWQQEGAACIPMAARVVVGVETGNAIAVKDIRATAARVAGFDADGTDWPTTPNILAAYGVKSHEVEGASLDTLRASLDAGHAPLVVVDPNAIWNVYGLFGVPGEEHAVVVAGIDDARHVITLVDSAWTGGMAETVYIPTFLTAWDAVGDPALLVG